MHHAFIVNNIEWIWNYPIAFFTCTERTLFSINIMINRDHLRYYRIRHTVHLWKKTLFTEKSICANQYKSWWFPLTFFRNNNLQSSYLYSSNFLFLFAIFCSKNNMRRMFVIFFCSNPNLKFLIETSTKYRNFLEICSMLDQIISREHRSMVNRKLLWL